MGALVWLVIVIVVISAVVGFVAQILNKFNEMNKPAARPAARAARREADDDRPAARPSSDKDMDRFLAEIDRLRRKNAETAGQPAPEARPGGPPRVAQPVAPSVRQKRARVVAELAEARRPDPPRPRRGVDTGAMAAPPAPVAPGTLSPTALRSDLPLPTVTTPTSATGAPATSITRFTGRARPAAKTDLGKNLTSLLGSAQGVALAVILQEVLGPPKSAKR